MKCYVGYELLNTPDDSPAKYRTHAIDEQTALTACGKAPKSSDYFDIDITNWHTARSIFPIINCPECRSQLQ